MINKLNIILCEPRGFCAGVERAIEIVERALKKYGAPIYVRHEIVHNRWVVEDLRNRGVIFVDEIDDIPENAVTIFSAHGISEQIENLAKKRGLPIIDATCPLVTKVHYQAQHYEKDGCQIILIGHAGHPEVEGTSGRVKNPVWLVSSVEDVQALNINEGVKLAYVTQTTLSVDDTSNIIKALKEKFPQIMGPELNDICYATQNRQNAVKQLAGKADILLVIGATNSSNSSRLRDLGEEIGIVSYLINDCSELNPEWLTNKNTVAITAGASAPEHLVMGVIDKLRQYRDCSVENLVTIREDIKFKLPPEIRYDEGKDHELKHEHN